MHQLLIQCTNYWLCAPIAGLCTDCWYCALITGTAHQLLVQCKYYWLCAPITGTLHQWLVLCTNGTVHKLLVLLQNYSYCAQNCWYCAPITGTVYQLQALCTNYAAHWLMLVCQNWQFAKTRLMVSCIYIVTDTNRCGCLFTCSMDGKLQVTCKFMFAAHFNKAWRRLAWLGHGILVDVVVSDSIPNQLLLWAITCMLIPLNMVIILAWFSNGVAFSVCRSSTAGLIACHRRDISSCKNLVQSH